MRFLVVRSAALLALLCTPVALAAQAPDVQYDAPPHLSLLDGDIEIVRAGRRDAATIGLILESGDRVDIRNGRAEILFGDGSALHLDTATTLDVLDDGLLRLLGGRIYLHVAESGARFEYRLDTPAASVYTDTPGEYRIVIDGGGDPTLELAVSRGLASATTPQDSVAVRAGEMVRIRAGDRRGRPVAFNVAYWDDFGRWSYERRYGRTDASARNLPVTIGSYRPAFAQYGHWDHHATYGSVWYPRVDRGWRPFYHGRWTSIAPYGWTWAGVDPWSWPTHHYGAWGVTPVGAWFWIPGSQWRPAPVHWTVTAAHVGWVPWGYGGVGAFGFTLIPRRLFASNVFVPQHVVHVHGVQPVVRNVFVAQPPPVPYVTNTGRAFEVTRRPAPARVALPRPGSVPSANVDQRPVAPIAVDNARPADSRVASPQRAAIGRTPVASAATGATVAVVPPAAIPMPSQPADERSGEERRGGYRIALPRGGSDAPRAVPPPAPAAERGGTRVAVPRNEAAISGDHGGDHGDRGDGGGSESRGGGRRRR